MTIMNQHTYKPGEGFDQLKKLLGLPEHLISFTLTASSSMLAPECICTYYAPEPTPWTVVTKRFQMVEIPTEETPK